MKGHVVLGSSRSFELKSAVLVYDEGDRCFATVHDVVYEESGGAPSLAPGRALGPAFLQALVKAIGGTVRPEILPSNVLCRTPDMLCWWAPAQQRPMFFRTDDPGLARLNGLLYPHPALVFKVQNHSLYVRALASCQRPDASVNLMVAPYWNMYPNGNVCLGSMRVPRDLTLESYESWQQSFFDSAFTHAGTAMKLTRHPKGFLAMWGELAGVEAFPTEYLQASGQRLVDFVDATGE